MEASGVITLSADSSRLVGLLSRLAAVELHGLDPLERALLQQLLERERSSPDPNQSFCELACACLSICQGSPKYISEIQRVADVSAPQLLSMYSSELQTSPELSLSALPELVFHACCMRTKSLTCARLREYIPTTHFPPIPSQEEFETPFNEAIQHAIIIFRTLHQSQPRIFQQLYPLLARASNLSPRCQESSRTIPEENSRSEKFLEEARELMVECSRVLENTCMEATPACRVCGWTFNCAHHPKGGVNTENLHAAYAVIQALILLLPPKAVATLLVDHFLEVMRRWDSSFEATT